MTLDLDNMKQAEFDKRMAEIKENLINEWLKSRRDTLTSSSLLLIL